MVSALIIAELARSRRWSRNLKPNFCPGRDLNPEPHDWQTSTLTTRPLHTPFKINSYRFKQQEFYDNSAKVKLQTAESNAYLTRSSGCNLYHLLGAAHIS